MFIRNILLVLLALYPFVSQTVWIKLFYLGGTKLSVLELYGTFIFFLSLIGLFENYSTRRVKNYNDKLILVFLLYFIIIGLFSFIGHQRPLISIIELLIRIATPYIFFSFFYIYLTNEQFKLKFMKVIWLSTLLASIVSVILYLANIGMYDVSQDVGRYAGFYGDAMSFSLVAVISSVFATLHYEKIRFKQQRQKHYSYWIVFTYFITILIVAITLTKMTLIISAFFILCWFGIYRKKILLIAPAIIAIAIITFTESENVQKRFQGEIGAVQSITVPYSSIYDARGIGSGRFGRWINAYDTYMDDYTTSEQIFGTFNFNKVHNQYIGFLLLSGLVGLILFLVLVYRFIKRVIKYYKLTRSPEYFMAIVLLLMMIIIGFGYMSFTYTYVLWLTFILVSLINIKPVVNKPASNPVHQPGKLNNHNYSSSRSLNG